MYKAERIRRTKRIISKRKRKLMEKFGDSWRIMFKNNIKPYEYEDGYYENNDIMNKFGQSGVALKTKTKHGHATYRHKCAYGPAKRYSGHDQKQLDQTNPDEEI